MKYNKPYLIDFSKHGDSSIGFISVAQIEKNIPFEIKRVFWTYFTPESIVRGRHAHYTTEQVLLAVSGRIIITTELANGETNVYTLDKPNFGLYIPPNVWHTMQYSHNAVQLVLASIVYDSNDYIREFNEFKKIY
jgi:mannose-6-phosphate isomerase-like protein (cupin superfamily)